MQRLRTLALALLATATLAACGDDSPTGPKVAAGGFKGSVTGSVARSLQGQALFGSDVDPEAGGFGVGLFQGDTTFILFARENGTRPAVGTYAFFDGTGEDAPTADQFIGLANFSSSTDESGLSFISTGGQLRITTSTASAVAGTFTMTGRCVGCGASGTDLAVELTGNFNAITLPGAASVSAAFQVQQARVFSRR